MRLLIKDKKFLKGFSHPTVRHLIFKRGKSCGDHAVIGTWHLPVCACCSYAVEISCIVIMLYSSARKIWRDWFALFLPHVFHFHRFHLLRSRIHLFSTRRSRAWCYAQEIDVAWLIRCLFRIITPSARVILHFQFRFISLDIKHDVLSHQNELCQCSFPSFWSLR